MPFSGKPLSQTTSALLVWQQAQDPGNKPINKQGDGRAERWFLSIVASCEDRKDPERQQSIKPVIATHCRGLRKVKPPTGNQVIGCMFRLRMDHMKEMVPIMWLIEKSEDSEKVQRAQLSEEGQVLWKLHSWSRWSLKLCPRDQYNEDYVRCWTSYCFSIFIIFLMFCFPFIISSKILKNKKVLCLSWEGIKENL